jgi:hypothetical protein
VPIYQVEHVGQAGGTPDDEAYRAVEVVVHEHWWLPMERVTIQYMPGGAFFVRGRVRASSDDEAEALLEPVLREAAFKQGLPDWPTETTVCLILDDLD